jgi:hypothetical protein
VIVNYVISSSDFLQQRIRGYKRQETAAKLGKALLLTCCAYLYLCMLVS